MLAVVANENVKIYDSARDIISPHYNFKVLVAQGEVYMVDELHLVLLNGESIVPSVTWLAKQQINEVG